MFRRLLYPVLAFGALGLAFSFNGCSCHAEAGTQTAKAPEPPPPPAPPPAPAPPAPEPPKEEPKPKLVSVGKAQIKGDEVKIPGAIEFDVDKATIKETPQTKEILSTMVEFMSQNKQATLVSVEGYTDSSGVKEHNQQLSADRAASVVKYLTDHGVEASRLEAHGYGADHAIAPNDTAEHKALNRRTEFHVRTINGRTVTAGSDLSGGGAGGASTTSTTSADAGAAPSTAATPKGVMGGLGKGSGKDAGK